MENYPTKAKLIDILRRVRKDSGAEITEPSGWSYYANYIGLVMNEAADEIERLQKEKTELRQKLIDQQNYILQLDRRQNADLQHDDNLQRY